MHESDSNDGRLSALAQRLPCEVGDVVSVAKYVTVYYKTYAYVCLYRGSQVYIGTQSTFNINILQTYLHIYYAALVIYGNTKLLVVQCTHYIEIITLVG